MNTAGIWTLMILGSLVVGALLGWLYSLWQKRKMLIDIPEGLEELKFPHAESREVKQIDEQQV